MGCSRGDIKPAKLFRKGRSQGVRLPREFRFEGDHVFVKKAGRGILLPPASGAWDSLVHSLTRFSGDFMEDRDQPSVEQSRQFR